MLKKVGLSQKNHWGIGKNHRAMPLPKDLRVFGADTETVHGEPHTVQIYDGKTAPRLFYVKPKTIFPTFWREIKKGCLSHGVNLCYFHNLKFDLVILFYQWRKQFYEQFNDIRFTIPPGIEVKAIFGKVNAATLKQNGMTVRLLDSHHFTQTSLERSAQMFQIPFSKRPMPKGLGEEYLDTEEFEDYSKGDVIVEYHLARKILDFHNEYKVSPSISLPQFASKVFRHYYFEPDTKIVFPPPEAVRPCELSYHGGKNGFYLPGPALIKNVWEVDINSSYPNAMRHLPQMTKGDFYRVKKFEPGYHGVYKLSGWADPDRRYPLLFDPAFKRVDGTFEGIWQTSYEVELMLGSPHYKFTVTDGFLWDPAPYPVNPFQGFVDDFYKKKEETPRADKAMYNFYKITLNALYGKFISTVEKREIEESDEKIEAPAGFNMAWDDFLKKYVLTKHRHAASGMYNPFVGTLITGFARAELYKLEVKYEALHSATDSVKTLRTPLPVSGLGGTKLECFGPCYFFRNKFYLHYAESFDHCSHLRGQKIPELETGEHLCKVALHGYKAKNEIGLKFLVDRRDELLENHHLRYDYFHVVGLREGLRRGESPADFVKRDEIVCLCVDSNAKCADFGGRCHCHQKKS